MILDPSKAELHGAELHLIPVIVAEFVNLVVQYPIVFTKNGETGEFTCVAMLGFEENENLFWEKGQWQGIYLPLQIQRQPFFVGNASAENHDKPSDFLLCVDTDSPTILKQPCENNQSLVSLFMEDGKASDYLSQAKDTLSMLLQGEKENKSFISVLKKLNLIQPLSLEISFINDQKTRLNGLYTIDQEKLASLSSEHIVELHSSGWLQAIYTMVASLGQIYPLIDLKNKRL